MRLLGSLFSLALLVGFNTASQADVFLCATETGQVSAQSSACAAIDKRAEPDLGAAYAGMTDEQINWYIAYVRCTDSKLYRQGHEQGDVGRQAYISEVALQKNLPPYFEAQFDAAVNKRGSAVKRNPSAFVACTQQSDLEPAAKQGSSVSLLSFIHLEGLHTAAGKAATWMNWAFNTDNETMDLVASAGDIALFSSGKGFLHAVDITTGKANWTYVNDSEFDEVVIAADRVYFNDDDQQTLKVLDLASGKLLAPLSRNASINDLQAFGDVLLFNEGNVLVALNGKTGSEQWRIPLSEELGSTVSVYQQTVLVLENQNLLYAFDLASGKPRWKRQMKQDGDLNIGTAVYFNATFSGKLLTLDASTGKTLHTLDFFSEEESVEVDRYAAQGYKTSTESNQLEAINLRTGEEGWLVTPPEGFRLVQLAYTADLVLMIGEAGEQILLVDRKTGKITDQLHTPGVVSSENAQNTVRALLSNDSSLLVF